MVNPMIIRQRNRRVIDRIGRIRDNIPVLSDKLGRMVAEKNAQHIKIAAGGMFSRPRGQLRGSIRPTRNAEGQYGVLGSYYAWFVDQGRKPGRRPPTPPSGKLTRWAGGQLEGRKFSRWIGKHGTRPKPFIREGMRTAHKEWANILKNKADFFIKSGGKV